MLRLITDPEPDLQEAATTGTAETGLGQLVRGVFGLAWIIGPVAPRSVARLESATVRVELVAGSGELVLHLRNEQAAAAPVMLVVPPLRSAEGHAAQVAAEPRTVVVFPGETRRLLVQLRIDPETAPGVYSAELRLLGADEFVIPVVAEVRA